MKALRYLTVYLMIISCFPQGDVGVQPTRIQTTQGPATVSGNKTPTQSNGLPEFCTYQVKDQETSCIRCESEGVTSLKCFEVFEPIDPQKICKHSAQSIQCLISRGPMLITLAFGQTLEDEFFKALPEVFDTLIGVVSQEESLTVAGRKALIDLVVFFKENQQHFFEDGDWLQSFNVMVGSLCLDTCQSDQVQSILRQHLTILRRNRAEGTLGVLDVLHMIAQLNHAINPDPQAKTLFDRINPDGLTGH